MVGIKVAHKGMLTFKMNKGLGDTVSSAIKKVSGGRIKECGGCSKRRDWLNEKVSYRRSALDAIDKIQGNV